jgi:hypothetical protein
MVQPAFRNTRKVKFELNSNTADHSKKKSAAASLLCIADTPGARNQAGLQLSLPLG